MPAPASPRPARGRALALAVLLGLAAAAGQAPLAAWWAALPAYAGILALVARAPGWRAAMLRAWAAGAGQFAAAMFWIVDPFFVDAAHDGWMAPFALVLMSGGLALFWAAAGAAGHLLGRGPRGRAAALAVSFALADLARGYVLTGLPWALVGHIWIGAWPAQTAALWGAVGLSFLTLAAAAAPVALGIGRGLALAALILGGVGLWGKLRLDAPEPAPAIAAHVRLVQPDAEQSAKWRDDMERLFFTRQLDLSAARDEGRPAPDLVVWPETAVPFLLNRPDIGLELIAEAAAGARVALGIQRSSGTRYYNSLAVLDPDASVAAVYDKHHLVPFGEYIPGGDLLAGLAGITAFAPAEGYGYSPGPGPAVLDLGRLGQVLPIICYEAVFPQDLRVPTRPDWMLQVTNDGWFGTLSGPYQHLAQARLRAIEQGLPLLRAANTGVSAVIDARGRVLQSLGLGVIGRIDTTVPAALPATPYARLGDLPVLVLLAGLAALLAAARLRKAR